MILDQSISGFELTEVIARCARERPLAVGFYTYHEAREKIAQAMAALRARFKALGIICGGPGAFDDLRYLRSGCDFVVRGEGERALPELLAAVGRDGPFDAIKGLSFLDGAGKGVRTPERELEPDLDAIPPPTWIRRSSTTPTLTALSARRPP